MFIATLSFFISESLNVESRDTIPLIYYIISVACSNLRFQLGDFNEPINPQSDAFSLSHQGIAKHMKSIVIILLLAFKHLTKLLCDISGNNTGKCEMTSENI